MKMKKTVLTFSICIMLLLAAVPGASAATCAATGTYASLIALGSTGCTLGPGNDKLFSNFTFAGSSGGTSAPLPTAAATTYIIENPGTSTQTGDLVYGFIFNPGLSVVNAGSVQTQDALLNYDITLAGANRIRSIHLFEVAIATGGGVASVSETDTACVAVGNCSFITDSVSTAGGIGIHNDLLGLNLVSLHVSKDINVTTGIVAGATASISGVRDSVDQTVPEPATYSYMLGGALVLLGGLRRRKA